jgi:hypothetical protein
MKIFGYIDPGLGALIWQSIVAAFVGFLFYLKKTRRWIVGVYRKISGRGRKSTTITTTVTTETPAAKVEVKTKVR